MNTTLRLICITLGLLGAGSVNAADDEPVGLDLRTQDDDLREGGEVWFVLRMNDGTVQSTALVRGERLADRTLSKYTVGPKAPYTWSDVKEWGLHARTHAGDGMALRPDTWRVSAGLNGTAQSCANYKDVARACFTYQGAEWQFTGDSTQYRTLSATVLGCGVDADCNAGNFCGTGGKRLARCAPRDAKADRHGCVRLDPPVAACKATEMCDETNNACMPASCDRPDRDGDGHQSIECGGDDCDDNDANRYPGNSEVCNDGHDEDCDITTVGERDADGDGFTDYACWNAR